MRFLLLNQTFHPDVMATGQYLTEVALGLVERGHQVTVLTSRRAYDYPEMAFPKQETWRGIRIIRVASTGFGKSAKWRRAVDFASFLTQCACHLALLPRHDVVVALTSPPLISFLGAGAAWIRRSRFVYWVMDMNPDEAIAAGWLPVGSLAAWLLERMSRFSLRRATRVIALDHFMRDRIASKGISPAKIAVVPPWSHDDDVRFDPAGRERFRKAHGLEGKFVVMYSGNHSPCHPLDTLLEAANRLRGQASTPAGSANVPIGAFSTRQSVVFCFVGGGSEWRRIKGQRTEDRGQRTEPSNPATRHAPSSAGNPQIRHSNAPSLHSSVVCLPYQPLSELSASLSAADLHVVAMGDPFVGIVHPCKIYNILSVGTPVLYIGPAVSHLSEIAQIASKEVPWFSARHGDVDQVIKHIQSALVRASKPSEDGRTAHPGLFTNPQQAAVGQASPPAGSAYVHVGVLPRPHYALGPGLDATAVRALFSKEKLLPKLISELEVK